MMGTAKQMNKAENTQNLMQLKQFFKLYNSLKNISWYRKNKDNLT